jgi:hypothetical protein
MYISDFWNFLKISLGTSNLNFSSCSKCNMVKFQRHLIFKKISSREGYRKRFYENRLKIDWDTGWKPFSEVLSMSVYYWLFVCMSVCYRLLNYKTYRHETGIIRTVMTWRAAIKNLFSRKVTSGKVTAVNVPELMLFYMKKWLFVYPLDGD